MHQRPLYITENDVAHIVDIRDAINALEEAFTAWRDPATANIPRQRAPLPGGMFNLMGAVYGRKNVYGCKSYGGGPSGALFNILLYDIPTRRLLAVFEANLLSQLRTGAASGLATKLMANADAKTLGCIGTGRQARAQVLAVCAVRPIEHIRVYSRSPANRSAFADAMAAETGVEVIPVESAEACVTDTDVVVLITKAVEPVIRSAWIRDGAHINAAGANAANRREVDVATIERASLLVTDDKDQALIEAAEFRDLVDAGRLSWDAVHELGDLVMGTAPRRSAQDEVTLFKSLGVALEDIAFADLIYRRALERGVGARL